MKNDKQRAAAVARLFGGHTKYEDEARRTGISIRQLQRMVAKHKAAVDQVKTVTTTGTADVVTPPEETSQKPENAALKAAKAGAGLTKPDGKDGATSSAPAAALSVDEMKAYCLETAENLFGGMGEALVWWQYTPPLSTADPEVAAALKLGPMAKGAVVANAERLYPYCVKLMNGWGPLAAVLAFSFLGMSSQLKKLALSKGWQPPAPGQQGAPPQVQIPPQRPAPVPPPMTAEKQIDADRRKKVDEMNALLKPGSPDPKPGQILDFAK